MLLDQSMIDELKMVAGSTPELLDELIDAYLIQLPEFLEDIWQGIETQNGDQLNNAAHSLKGASYNMGALQVGELSAQLEEQGRLQDFMNAAPLLSALKAACRATEVALQALKNR